MKNNLRGVLGGFLAMSFMVSAVSPVFAQQRYQAPYTYKPTYTQQQYQQPQYQQQQYQPSYSRYQMQPLQGRVATIPAGTTLSVSLPGVISSQYATVGDAISTTLATDLIAGSSVALPAGTQIVGQVVQAEKAGGFGKNGVLNIRFNSAITPNGQTIPISGKIATEDGTGIIYGGTTAGRVGKAAATTAIGAGLGAALGTGLGPAAGGKAGKGAIYGTAIGGGVGLLGNAVRKGNEAVLKPTNGRIDIILDQPAAINQSTGY